MEKNMTYGYGHNVLWSEKEIQKFTSAAICAQKASASGYSFIMGYAQNGDKAIFAWNARVVSKEQALDLYWNDGDKRPFIAGSSAMVWIIIPMNGCSDILIPYGENGVRAFYAVKLDELM